MSTRKSSQDSFGMLFRQSFFGMEKQEEVSVPSCAVGFLRDIAIPRANVSRQFVENNRESWMTLSYLVDTCELGNLALFSVIIPYLVQMSPSSSRKILDEVFWLYS